LTLAQWALESAWGTSVPGNNPFGIKAYPHCYATQELPTWEVENGRKVRKKQTFAVFPTLEDAFLKHAALLVTGDLYLPSFVKYFHGQIELNELARAIGKYYATDPEYGNKLVRIMHMPDVQAAWKAVAGEKAA
jgi:flagellum-specific peptidoglycan hydrolase FlgJ